MCTTTRHWCVSLWGVFFLLASDWRRESMGDGRCVRLAGVADSLTELGLINCFIYRKRVSTLCTAVCFLMTPRSSPGATGWGSHYHISVIFLCFHSNARSHPQTQTDRKTDRQTDTHTHTHTHTHSLDIHSSLWPVIRRACPLFVCMVQHCQGRCLTLCNARCLTIIIWTWLVQQVQRPACAEWWGFISAHKCFIWNVTVASFQPPESPAHFLNLPQRFRGLVSPLSAARPRLEKQLGQSEHL